MRETLATPRGASNGGRALIAFLALASAAASAAALCGGCSDLDNGTFGASAGIVYPVVKAEPRPSVEIASPARGAFLAVGPVAVEGRVHPAVPGGATPTSLQVGGAVVPVAPDGTFRTLLPLARGLNVIRAVTRDGSGRPGFAAVGVLAGDYAPAGAAVANGLGLRVNDAGLMGLAKLLEDFVATYDWRSLSAQQIYTTRVLGFAQVDAYLDRLLLGPVAVLLDAERDGLHARVAIEGPVIDLSAVVSLGGGPLPPETISVLCDRIVVSARAHPVIAASGQVELSVEDPAVDLVNMRVHSASPVIRLVDALLRDVVRRFVEDQAKKLLRAQRPASEPFDVELLPGVPKLHVELRGRAIRLDSGGFEVMLDADCAPLAGSALYPRAAAAPGSFKTPGTPPQMRSGNGLHLAIDDDLLNRIAHGAWSTGVLATDAETLTRAMSPTTNSVPLMLARDLKQLLPELNHALPDAAPVNFLFEALLPPIFSTAAPDLLRIDLGELHVTVVVDRGRGFEPVLKAALHVSTSAGVAFDQSGLRLATSRAPSVVFDVLEKPLVEIDDRRLEVAINLIAVPAIPHFLSLVKTPPPQILQGLSVLQVAAFPDGLDGDYASVMADLSR